MALKPLNSVGGFSVGEIPANIILANGDITSNNATFTSNVAAGNILTNNLLYANGSAWDFANPAGANTELQYNDGTGNFAASANLKFDYATNILTVIGNIVSTNANLGNAATANFFIGSGANLSNLPGANVSGFVPNANIANTAFAVAGANVSGEVSFAATANSVAGANVSGFVANANIANTAFAVAGANVSGQVSNALVSGTVYTNAQPNITSVGTLTSLDVSGTITAANITANSGIFTGNGAGLTNIAGANVTGNVANATHANVADSANSVAGANVTGAVGSATIAGTVTTAAQPNITSVGTLTSLNVSGVSNLGPVGNVIITGGNNGYYLQTNGSGNLSWAEVPSGTGISNGTSNVSIPVINSNINMSVGGNVGVMVVTATGANITGTLNATANANVGNLGTGGLITATGNVAGANLITAGNVFAPAIVQNASTYDTRITLNSAAGIIEANAAGNATQFLPGGTMRLPSAGASDIVGGTFDGSKLTLNNNDAIVSQSRGGNVKLQVGTGGTIANTWTFAQDGSFTSPGNITTSANANVGNLNTGGAVVATGNISGNNLSITNNANVGNVISTGSISATGNITSNANVVTDLIVGRTSSVTITATGSNQNINLTPTGTGTVNVGNFIISNVATPVASSDAATKQYVDDVAQGLHTHDSCNAATSTTLASISGGTVTYNNGTSGVGATLTTTGTYTTIDGVTLSVGMRILVKNEVSTANNGIYDVTSSTVLTRSADFNTPTEMAGGDFTFVTAGTLYDNTGWVMPDPVTTVGTSPVVWVQFSGAGTYTAGTGLVLNGNEFSIATTTVTAGSYGNGDSVATFTVNGQGQLSAAANVAITANAANLTGSSLASNITTSNLTSFGTVTGMSVTGNITAANVYANAGTIGASLLGGTLTTASQPNVTSVGTLSSLAVTGNITGGNIATTGIANIGTLSVTGVTNLGPVGNVIITGGSSGYYLQTNGSGNLTWAAVPSGNGISNGTSNISIPVINGNINMSAGGTSDVVIVTGTGANVTGTLNVTANANVGNLGTGGLIVATGNVTGGNLVTSGIATVTGNVVAGNLQTAGNVYIGNTEVRWSNVTTSNTDANLTIASTTIPSGISGVRYFVKGTDVTGTKYTVATVQAVTNGSSVDYAIYGGVSLGGTTGSLAVNLVGGNLALQVTAASSNSTVWVTQFQLI